MMNDNDKVMSANDKVILSFNGSQKECNFDEFIKSLDTEIIDIKSVTSYNSTVTHNIFVVSKEKSEENNQRHFLDEENNFENEYYPEKYIRPIKSLIKIDNKVDDKIDFINRKQKLELSKAEHLSLTSKNINNVAKLVARDKKKLIETFEMIDEKDHKKDSKNIKMNFEDGLKSMLSKLAIEQLKENNEEVEIENTPFNCPTQDIDSKCKEYCRSFVYPLFMYIKNDLLPHERYVKVQIDLDLLLVSLEVIHKNKSEYDYVINIKNSKFAPVLQIKNTDSNGGLKVRKSLTDINIDVVSRVDIYQDFLDSYKNYLCNSVLH